MARGIRRALPGFFVSLLLISTAAGYSLVWSGLYENRLRTKEKLKIKVPLTLPLIVLLPYLSFRSPEAAPYLEAR